MLPAAPPSSTAPMNHTRGTWSTLVLALAVAGYGLSLPWRRKRLDWWAAGGAAAVYAVYAAPVVASGKATFAGYITLDDTSTWLALTDRAMEHGRKEWTCFPWGSHPLHWSVREWSSGWFNPTYYETMPLEDPKGAEHGEGHTAWLIWSHPDPYGPVYTVRLVAESTDGELGKRRG